MFIESYTIKGSVRHNVFLNQAWNGKNNIFINIMAQKKIFDLKT